MAASMELLNPTHEEKATGFESPARLTTLRGATIGIISNGKENTAPFFDEVERLLVTRHGVTQVIRRVKPNYSAPAPADLMAESQGWSAALAGVGD